MKKTFIIFTIFILAVPLLSQIQEWINESNELWERGRCVEAVRTMEKVLSRINDLPDQHRKEVERIYSSWRVVLDGSEQIAGALRLRFPQTQKITPQNAFAILESVAVLKSEANKIECKDIRDALLNSLELLQNDVHFSLDTVVTRILMENEELSRKLDSVRVLAKKYSALRPVVDSLRKVVWVYSESTQALKAQLDTILIMASQGASILKGMPAEEFREVATPVGIAAIAFLKQVEGTINALGEAIVYSNIITSSQKDSILARFEAIESWLDTSLVARTAPQEAEKLKALCAAYKASLEEKAREGKFIWIGLALVAVVLFVIILYIVLKKSIGKKIK